MAFFAASACGLSDVGHDREPPPKVLFDCGDGKSRIRLLDRGPEYLAIEKQLEPGAATLEIFMWAEVRIGYVVGQQGGHQSHVRFDDGGESFVLFEGEDGQSADMPGRTYAGVVAVRSANEAELAKCARSELNAHVVDAVSEYYRRKGVAALPAEEPGGRFDGWF